jgi:hypothetical protein
LALRPLGKVIVHCSSQGGAFCGTRFWKKKSCSGTLWKRFIVVGRSRRCAMHSSATAR